MKPNFIKMKSLLSFLTTLVLLCTLALPAHAQQHLKFMGIPLNGTIDNFQNKLAAKGVTVDPVKNKIAPVGLRIFKGNFTSRSCTICVFYTNSKIVYRAKAIFSSTDEDTADQFYNRVKNLLNDKYSEEYTEEDTSEGYPSVSVFVSNETGKVLFGEIDLYKSKEEYDYLPDEYWIQVDYNDYINRGKKDQEDQDDL